MLSSRFISIAVALMFAAGAAAAQTNAGKEGEKKSDGAVTTAAKATGKATADGAKATGKKSAEVAKATGDKSAEVAKATGKTTAKGAKATAGGAKRLGLGIKDAVTPGDDSKEKKEK